MRWNDRIGERKIMNCGEECEIIDYKGSMDITVRFIKTGELVKSQYIKFKNGEIKSHFTPSVYNIGIVGLEETRMNGKMLKSYRTWFNMLSRCYDEKYQDKNPTYTNCKVAEEWHYYPNFKKWYEENYYEIQGQKMCLDKDILNKNNKIYSPDSCVFVPHNINALFTKRNKVRGDLPIGVCLNKTTKKYQTYCKILNTTTNKSKQKYFGLYENLDEAFSSYKKAKEENIKQIADYYKDQIPNRLYEAMYRYEVEITD